MVEHIPDYLTTRELAHLLRIKERKVYDLAASGDVPCSRATGKLLFPRGAIEAWIAHHSSGPPGPEPERPGVFLGSHDPLLEWSLRQSRCALATYLDGSLDGLRRFCRGEGVAAGIHLFSPASSQWNVPSLQRQSSTAGMVLVEFAWRERGLLVARDRAKTITGIESLKGCRVVARQPEAGAQVLFEHVLDASGLSASQLSFSAPARSESDAALAVADGKADAAFGLMSLAQRHRLEFLPVMRERFDLLVDRRAWFEPPLQAFIGFCASEAFREKAREFGGYDVRGFATVHFNGP